MTGDATIVTSRWRNRHTTGDCIATRDVATPTGKSVIECARSRLFSGDVELGVTIRIAPDATLAQSHS